MKVLRSAGFALAVAVSLAGAGFAQAAVPAASGNPVFDRTVQIVLDNFYTTAKLDAFRGETDRIVAETPALKDPNVDPAVVNAAIDRLLASLQTSHTARYTTDRVDYYELLDVFRFNYRDEIRRMYPRGEIRYPGIGIASRILDGKRFVTDVYDGGPADKAGVEAGDQILSVDGKPFEEVRSFAEMAGQPAVLELRRSEGATPIKVTVTVASLQPSEALLDAIANSETVIDRDGRKIGYLRIWAYTRQEVGGIINEALATGKLKDVDGLVVDARSRWGGAPGDAAEVFVGGTGDFRTIDRDGDVDAINMRWHKPVVAIIDEGTRSGMELFAYALKKNGIPLIGTRTAGALVAGRGYLLPDDSLLVLAVEDVTVDGIRLEAKGVEPDVTVPFDIRYAAGKDPQLDAALARLDAMI